MSIAPAAREVEDLLASLALVAAGEQGQPQTRRCRRTFERRQMLAGEDFGRRHQRRLGAAFDGADHRQQGHHRLARADVALQQPQHARRRPHIGVDLGQRSFLGTGRAGRAGRR